MSIEQIRTRVVGSIWQAIAQSKTDLTALPRDQQDQLVNTIADNVMITMNEILDDAAQPPSVEPALEDEEKVLWEGRPFLSLIEFYIVTDERIKIRKGLLGRDFENFELIRVQDIDYSQGLTERMLGIGDIQIRGHDASDPEIMLRNIPKPEEVYEILRKGWLAARKRHGLQFREYM